MQLVAEDGELRTPDGDVAEGEYLDAGCYIVDGGMATKVPESIIKIGKLRHTVRNFPGLGDQHDDEQDPGTLALAGAALAAGAFDWQETAYSLWPFGKWEDNKVGNKRTQDRIDMLVRSGAFIAAEIDRLERVGK